MKTPPVMGGFLIEKKRGAGYARLRAGPIYRKKGVIYFYHRGDNLSIIRTFHKRQ